MTKSIQVSLLMASLLLPTTAAFAQVIGANGHIASEKGHIAATPVAINEVFKELDAVGLHTATEVKETQKGVFEVKAVDANGNPMEIVINTVDPSKTTLPAKVNAPVKFLTIEEIVSKLGAEGYEITRISMDEDGFYRVTAILNGESHRYHVNAITAVPTKSWF